MKTKELIELINTEKPYALCYIEDILPDDENNVFIVAEGLDLDEHRWYSCAMNVYQCEDGFVGVFGPYQSFSEMQSWDDIGFHCEAFEVEQVPSVTYKAK